MQKKYSTHIILSLIFFLQYSDCFCQFIHEGLVKVTVKRTITSPSSRNDSLIYQENKIWFKDSSVIFAIRLYLESRESTAEGTILKKSNPVWRYMYLNLRTMACQDYLSFKDTAAPFCNYRFPLNEPANVWVFFAQKNASDTLHGVFPLNDTIINNTVFKRIKILYKYYDLHKDYGVYYLEKDPKKSIFHMNQTLSDMYPDYNAKKFDFFEPNGNIIFGSEHIITDKLTSEEECIFKKWESNAKNTKLPIISYSDVYKIILPYPEHENPQITIIPLKKRE